MELIPQTDYHKRFALQYNKMIKDGQLIRRGSEKEPIDRDLRVGENFAPGPNQYEEAMANPNGHDPEPIDFNRNPDGFIDPSKSSGKNFTSFFCASNTHFG